MTIEVVQLELVFLVVVRLLSFMVVSPVFNSKAIALQLRIFLGIMLGLLVVSLMGPQFVSDIPADTGGYMFFVVQETLLGLALGFVTRLIYTGIQLGGQMVDFQMGFSISAAFDPKTGATQGVIGRLYTVLALVFIFVLDIHHFVIYALFSSFQYIPVGTALSQVMNIGDLLVLGSRIFLFGLQIAVPVVLILLMVDIAMGLLSKTVPSLNVLMLGMPLKILVGSLVLLAIFPIISEGLILVLRGMVDYLDQIIRSV